MILRTKVLIHDTLWLMSHTTIVYAAFLYNYHLCCVLILPLIPFVLHVYTAAVCAVCLASTPRHNCTSKHPQNSPSPVSNCGKLSGSTLHPHLLCYHCSHSSLTIYRTLLWLPHSQHPWNRTSFQLLCHTSLFACKY